MRREHDQSLFVMASNTFLWLTETNVLLTYWKTDLPMEILDNLLHKTATPHSLMQFLLVL